MSNQNDSRRYRYKRRSSTTVKLIQLLIVGVLVAGCTASSLFLWKKVVTLKESLHKQKVMNVTNQRELDILRTLNPYHVESNEVLAKAVENADLYPGWVARVYPVPEKAGSVTASNDIGSFVMNETRFSLSSHKRYGITHADKSMYRLNGLFPSHKPGRLQVAVAFYLKKIGVNYTKDTMSQIGSCYARIDINQKRVIEQKLHIVTKFEREQILTGDVDLQKGLYPISAVVYCDRKSDFAGEDVEVAISFRNPTQQFLTTSRYSIFHVYKPDSITAKL